MNKKQQQALVVIGAITVAYVGFRAVAVALDPEVHAALGNVVKTSVAAAKTAANAPVVKK